MSVAASQITRTVRVNSETKGAADNAESVATRSSSLHYFIATLLSEKIASALDGFTVKEKPHAYVIELPALDPQAHLGTSDCFILKHARFIERHLRVDEFFAPSTTTDEKHDFPYCHYTETYETPDGKHIVVHVCINKEGKVEHCKIKSVQTTQDADGTPSEVVAYFSDQFVNQVKSLAIKNAGLALKLFKKLDVQKLDKFLSLHKEVQDLDGQLSRLFLNLHKKKARADYVTLGEKFIKNIQILNNLNDSRYSDTRDTHIQRMCDRINADEFTPKTFEPPKIIETTSEMDTETAPAEQTAELVSSAKNRFKSETNVKRTKLVEMIEEGKTQLDKFPKEAMMDTKQLIERAKIVDDLRCNLSTLYCLPDNPKKELDLIATLEKKLEKIPTLLQSFESFAKSGRVSEVSELHPHIESHLSVSFIDQLVEEILHNPKDNNLAEKIAVCDYLNTNSALYRIAIHALNYNFTVKSGLAFSSLVTACDHQNKLAFEMLLRQGADPNEAGLIYGECIVPIMYAVLTSFEQERCYYVEKLLEYGSYLEFPNNYFDHLGALPVSRSRQPYSSKYALIINRTLQQMKARPHVDEKLRNEFISTVEKQTSGLLVACTLKPTSVLINLLAPKSSLDGLLCSIAFFAAGRAEIKTRFLPTSAEAGLHFYVNTAACNQHTMSYSRVSNNATTSMCLLYLSEEHKIDTELSEIMKNLAENFNKKYTQILEQDPKQLQILKAGLMRQAQEADNYDQKKMLYTACFYLQACKPNPTIQEKEEILQVCADSAKAFLNAAKETEWNSARTRCMWALAIVQTTKQEYANYLKTTSVFTSLTRLLEKANKKLKAPTEFLMLVQDEDQAPITQAVRVLQKSTRGRKK